MTAVDNGFDPETICTDVGLCTGKSMRFDKIIVTVKDLGYL